MAEIVDFNNFDDFQESDAALTRAGEALTKGTARFKHIRPSDEVNVIKAGLFYREHAKRLAERVQNMERERYQAGAVSMSLGDT